MRRLFLLLALFCTAIVQAQEVKMDKELTALMDVVKILRNPGEASFNEAKRLLMADEKWTAMSETGDLQSTECKPAENTPGFKLNRILSQVMKERKHVYTPGDMLNGEDSRYFYSLYERSLKKGKSATYKLKKRSGKQSMVFVPYRKKKGALNVRVNGKKPATTEQEDGTLICSFAATGKEFTLTVSNKSGAALSFVMINHNSRKQ